MNPGPELDAAVATALGAKYRESWKAEDGCWKMAGWYYEDSPAFKTIPRFSTDLNDAFEAAEKVELFKRPDDEACASLQAWRAGWVVVDEAAGNYKTLRERVIGCGRTPALAICAAILKLKE